MCTVYRYKVISTVVDMDAPNGYDAESIDIK